MTILFDADPLLTTIGKGDDLFATLTEFDHTSLTGLVGGLDEALRSNTPRVEGTHRELGARFTNGLGRNRAHGKPLFHQAVVGHVHAVALGTHATWSVATKNRTDEDLIDAQAFNRSGNFGRDQLIFLHHNLVRHGVHDGVQGDSAGDGF